jgi:hypothetical protein
MFCHFCLVKYHKIVQESAKAEAIEKVSTYLGSFKFWSFFYVRLTKFEDNHFLHYKINTLDEQIFNHKLLNKFSHQFLVTKKITL